MRMRIWAGQLSASAVADLRDAAWLSWLGLGEDALLDDDYRPCQAAGEALIGCGAAGLIVPSAAKPDGLNLVLFRRMVRGDWRETAMGPELLRFREKVLPCKLIARGRPSADLVNSVRFKSV